MLTMSDAIHGLVGRGMYLMALNGVATFRTGVVITNVVAMRPKIVNIVGPLLVVYRIGGGVGLLCSCMDLGHQVGWHHDLLWPM